MIQFSFCKLTHNGSLCSLAHSWDPTANHFIPSILPQTRKGASQELIGGAFWVLQNANSKDLTKVLLSHLRAGAIRPQRGWQGSYTKVKQFKPLSFSLRNLVRYKRRYGSREINSYMSKISSNGTREFRILVVHLWYCPDCRYALIHAECMTKTKLNVKSLFLLGNNRTQPNCYTTKSHLSRPASHTIQRPPLFVSFVLDSLQV